jgi:cell division protein FtsL
MNYSVRRFLHGAIRRWWLIAFVIATLWVWQRYAVVQAGHRIAERRARIEKLTEIRDELLAQTTTLSSRPRIEAIAISRLGLRPTRESQYASLSDGSLPADAIDVKGKKGYSAKQTIEGRETRTAPDAAHR